MFGKSSRSEGVTVSSGPVGSRRVSVRALGPARTAQEGSGQDGSDGMVGSWWVG
jgi:hypothetical protein